MFALGCAGNRRTVASVPPTPSDAPVPTAPSSEPLPGPTLTRPFEPGAYSEQGVASWYGIPFNGRRASSGEVFDMNQPVAAHRTLPFGSRVRVTNLNNGLATEVRIIDRGPFIEGRIIDLSRAAASSINMIGTGTAPVRLELLSAPAPIPGYFTVQIGAFGERENAERLMSQFRPRYPVFVQELQTAGGRFYRVRIGRESNQAVAQELATTLSGQGFRAFVVRMDGLH